MFLVLRNFSRNSRVCPNTCGNLNFKLCFFEIDLSFYCEDKYEGRCERKAEILEQLNIKEHHLLR